MADSVEIQTLSTMPEFEACVDLQRLTWGETFRDLVPAAILLVSQKIGGLVAGARGETGDLVGFVYSLAGRRDGRNIHWSHMLAVHPDHRGKGLGRRLKLFQRSELLKSGIDTVIWTFDPLVARNAHLNLNRLGVHVAGFVPDMYGDETGSPLHQGPTDRLVVRWDLASERTRWAVESDGNDPHPPMIRETPLIQPADLLNRLGRSDELPGDPSVRIQIPSDLADRATLGSAGLDQWRASVRRAFTHYLKHGYVVRSFHREIKTRATYYYLRRP